MTTRFKNAYDALYKAFINGTLAKGSCSACAIGNIVSAAQKGTIEIINNEVFSSTRSHFWSKIFVTENKSKAPKMLFFIKDTVEQTINQGKLDDSEIIFLSGELKRLTGYSANELAKVEYVFETASKIHYRQYPKCSERKILNDQFNGLMAVVDVLLELDNMKDEGYKESFKAHPKLVLVEN